VKVEKSDFSKVVCPGGDPDLGRGKRPEGWEERSVTLTARELRD